MLFGYLGLLVIWGCWLSGAVGYLAQTCYGSAMRNQILALGLTSVTLAAGVVLAPAAAAASTTTITFNVTGCNGCTITPVQWVDMSAEPWQGDPVTIVNGVATATVPTANTKGMSFNFSAPWAVQQNGLQNIVLQYKGAAVGSTPTRAQALDSKKASGCWAGVASGDATLDLRVSRVRITGFPESVGKGPYPVVFAAPTASALKIFEPTYKGGIGNQQGALPCKAS